MRSDANPLEDINNAKQIDMVIKDGQIIDRGKLDLPLNRQKAVGSWERGRMPFFLARFSK